jgi:cellulose synthase/poly-beta-1,6-N-acetylglucosamine synthase-like glycosyltransferase/peptidoglycan/xylan/chitin deacetylase (PgdA/CDA1 family)/spore germination protein YaaH
LSSPDSQIFYDPRGRRWKRVRRTWLALGVLATALASVFIVSVLVKPALPQLNLRQSAHIPHAVDARTQVVNTPPPTTPAEEKARAAADELKQTLKKTKFVPARRPSQIKVTPPADAQAQAPTTEGGQAQAASETAQAQAAPADAQTQLVTPASARPAASAQDDNQPQAPHASNAQAAQPVVPSGRPLAVGFYVNWDDSSYASLKRNINQLDWLVPEWIRLQDGDDPLVRDFAPQALDLVRSERPTMPILPLVQNYQNEQWNSQLLARAVATDQSRQKLINALLQTVEANKFAGVTVDLEEVPASSQSNLYKFMQELYASFHERGLLVAQAVPFDNPDWDYRAYEATTDYLMLMAYDQHWASSAPGSVASQQWFEQLLAKRMRELDPAKTIVCVGNYGYDWTSAGGEAPEVTFQEAVLSAKESDASVAFDPATRNPHFSYDEDDGSHHSVWFLDAVTAYNEMRASEQYHPAGFALWRLGSEDPSLWQVFGSNALAKADGKINDSDLRDIRYGYDIDFEGTGEILSVAAEPHDGVREYALDDAGYVTTESLKETPSSYVVERTGDQPGLVALTFDDGPDATWTPRILDILKQENVPATFFIIGEYGQENPALVKRIVADGHDIGNHSYTHPNLGEMPGGVTDLELNATERLIESLTGRSTILFRPPYFGDAEPTTSDEVEPIVRAKRLGYLTVGLHVDPDDWATPGTDEIVKRTVEGITSTSTDFDERGQIVLLHDGGGDRSQTVAALPRIIEQLRARGYRFVTVSQLAGLTQAQTMPAVHESHDFFARADAVTFYALSTGGRIIRWTFIIGIILGIGRLIFIGALALAQRLRSRRRERRHAGEGFEPFVSVIVPAFNEERVICKTIESLLASDYEEFEIVVVDDGSPDRTSEVVGERFSFEPRVRLFRKENGGKAEALNYGMAQARGEIVVCLDADTIFAPDTLRSLARRFVDPKIGAVAGNAKVGNRINLVTRWQALEYVTSQNLDRRAFSTLNCITVVPGAVGAWRRELVESVGGFSSDTLAEDQDLTLRVRRLGYEVGYEEDAVAWTEAPDTMAGLRKQRFRWSFGTLQCMWKHKGALFRHRALGFVAMPNVWIFQILFPLISPLMDLMFIWTFVAAALERLEHPTQPAVSNFGQVAFYYALFLAVDWVSAAFAFALEKREQWSLLWWLFLQRFGYRQVMYTVMVRSFLSAARGVLVGWGKLERKDTVALTQARAPLAVESAGD